MFSKTFDTEYGQIVVISKRVAEDGMPCTLVYYTSTRTGLTEYIELGYDCEEDAQADFDDLEEESVRRSAKDIVGLYLH